MDAEGVVRQTAYKGLEPGRDPLTVHREVAVATAGAVRAAEAEAPEPARAADNSSAPNYVAEPSRGKEAAVATAKGTRTRKSAAATAPPTESPTTGASPTTSSPPSTTSARKVSGTPTASS